MTTFLVECNKNPSYIKESREFICPRKQIQYWDIIGIKRVIQDPGLWNLTDGKLDSEKATFYLAQHLILADLDSFSLLSFPQKPANLPKTILASYNNSFPKTAWHLWGIVNGQEERACHKQKRIVKLYNNAWLLQSSLGFPADSKYPALTPNFSYACIKYQDLYTRRNTHILSKKTD